MHSAPWCCGRAGWLKPAARPRFLSAPREAYTRQLVDALPRRGAGSARSATGEPLVSVRALKVEFGGRQRLFRRAAGVSAVNGVDLDIGAGETVAVVGGSGSGKTTLGRAMLRLIPAAGGEIRFRGKEVTAVPDREFRLASQLVFQDPYSSLDPRMRVGEIVAEPLRHVPATHERRARPSCGGDIGGGGARRLCAALAA